MSLDEKRVDWGDGGMCYDEKDIKQSIKELKEGIIMRREQWSKLDKYKSDMEGVLLTLDELLKFINEVFGKGLI